MNAIEDADRLISITNGGYPNDIVNVYRTSNENLFKLFSNFRVQGKDVLTVLGSGDQAILSYLNGARSIDTFDKELYTYYCFYLRKWLIKYMDIHFIQIDMNYYTLLKEVKPNCEEEANALLFWTIYFKSTNYKLDKYMFAYSKEVDLIDKLSQEKIGDFKFKFYNIDICSNIKLEKRYDVVILSNILEWIDFNKYSAVLPIVGKNLENLLNPDGIAVCSLKIGRCEDSYHEKEISSITASKRLTFSKYENNLGYHYRKAM